MEDLHKFESDDFIIVKGARVRPPLTSSGLLPLPLRKPKLAVAAIEAKDAVVINKPKRKFTQKNGKLVMMILIKHWTRFSWQHAQVFSSPSRRQASQYMRFSVLLLMNFWIYVSEEEI